MRIVGHSKNTAAGSKGLAVQNPQEVCGVMGHSRANRLILKGVPGSGGTAALVILCQHHRVMVERGFSPKSPNSDRFFSYCQKRLLRAFLRAHDSTCAGSGRPRGEALRITFKEGTTTQLFLAKPRSAARRRRSARCSGGGNTRSDAVGDDVPAATRRRGAFRWPRQRCVPVAMPTSWE